LDWATAVERRAKTPEAVSVDQFAQTEGRHHQIGHQPKHLPHVPASLADQDQRAKLGMLPEQRGLWKARPSDRAAIAPFWTRPQARLSGGSPTAALTNLVTLLPGKGRARDA
jgi:hypothetical protein